MSDPVKPTTPSTPAPSTPDPSTGDVIASDISAVGDILAPIVGSANPAIGAGIAVAFKVLAAAEPVVYNAVVALMSGKDLTPDQEAAMTFIEAKLQDPDAYLA